MKLKKFDYTFLSYELNCRKPDEKIYEIVEKQSGFAPQIILLIDDTQENLKIPKRRGWSTCHANGHELEKIKESVELFLNNEKNNFKNKTCITLKIICIL